MTLALTRLREPSQASTISRVSSLRYDRSRIVERIRQLISVPLSSRLDPLGKAHGTARTGW